MSREEWRLLGKVLTGTATLSDRARLELLSSVKATSLKKVRRNLRTFEVK